MGLWEGRKGMDRLVSLLPSPLKSALFAFPHSNYFITLLLVSLETRLQAEKSAKDTEVV